MPQFQRITAWVLIQIGSPAAAADISVGDGPRSCDHTSIREAMIRVPACREAFHVACRFLRRNHTSEIDRGAS